MSTNQKCAWIQLLIFTAVLVSWLILFILNGTIFYWQNDSMMMIFYIISAIGFVALVLMNLIVSLLGGRRKLLSDERDKSIWRRASLWATGASYTVDDIVGGDKLITWTFDVRRKSAVQAAGMFDTEEFIGDLNRLMYERDMAIEARKKALLIIERLRLENDNLRTRLKEK